MRKGACPQFLSAPLMERAVADLCARDRDLARVVERHGPPPMWARPPGFATLVRIVLEQQVSLSSARAAFMRLRSGAGAVSASRIAALSPETLMTFGITRQKASFVHGLAVSMTSGRLPLRTLAALDDVAAREVLIATRGIGPWTADIYLVMALRRPDVWPDGDLALVKSLMAIKRLPSPPTADAVRRIAARWAPWRAIAARIVWHSYLSERRFRRA